jgi:pyruvate kinase
MRKTKIVCTLGPSTDDPKVLKELFENGMDVARLNFSHGTHEEQEARVDMVKGLREHLDLPVALLLDTKGPEIRIGSFIDGKIIIKKNDKFILTTDKVDGDNTKISVTYERLPSIVKRGDRILIDDGLVELIVDSVDNNNVYCTVNNDGVLSNKSITFRE